MSDTEFEYAGATRSIDSFFLSDGVLHLWMDMGNADALPNSMTLHVGDRTLSFADARHIDHDEGRGRLHRRRRLRCRGGTGEHDAHANCDGRYEDMETQGGRTLTPTLEVGLRHDAGNAQMGFGLEAGARVRYRDTATGFSLEASLRGLVNHEDDGYEEWGASATAMLDPNSAGRGLSLRLTPSWGQAAGGVDNLWSHDTPRWKTGPGHEDAGALDAEFDYGGRAPFGRGVVTPYTGLTLSQEGRRTWRVGERWKAAPSFRVTLEGSRGEKSEAEDLMNAVMLRGSIHW